MQGDAVAFELPAAAVADGVMAEALAWCFEAVAGDGQQGKQGRQQPDGERVQRLGQHGVVPSTSGWKIG